MSFLDDLVAKGKAPLGLLQRFRTSVKSGSQIALFVEGYEDREFYGYVTKGLGLEAEFYVCFGKKNLDETLAAFREAGLPSGGVLFIRDRDFDHARGVVVEAAPLFLTCGYSVENYVFTAASLKEFLSLRAGVSAHEVELDELAEQFSALCDSTFASLRPFHERLFEGLGRGVQVDLNAVSVRDIAKAILEGKDVTGVVEGQVHRLGLNDVPAEEVKIVVANYHAQPSLLGIRGKYLAEVCTVFLRHCLDWLLREHKAKKITYFNRRISSSISEESVFGLFAPISNPPKRLTDAFKSLV